MTVTISDNAHRAIVDLLDRGWHSLVPHHPKGAVARLYMLGMVRCDCDNAKYPDRLWTITPRGEEYLADQASQ